VLHEVEQPHTARFCRPRRCAALRIFSASDGMLLITIPPLVPAACTSLMADELALWIGLCSSTASKGMPAALASACGPALM